MLQSPDDPDATYRKKKEQPSKGYTINGIKMAVGGLRYYFKEVRDQNTNRLPFIPCATALCNI
jgi:hypothetical protein